MCDMKFAAKFAAKFAFNPRFMNVNQNPPEMLYVFSLAKAKVFPIVVDFHFFSAHRKRVWEGPGLYNVRTQKKIRVKVCFFFHSAISNPAVVISLYTSGSSTKDGEHIILDGFIALLKQVDIVIEI